MENLSIRLVFDRRKIATKTHSAAIYIEATYRKKRKFINTGINLLEGQWGNNCKVRNHPQSNILNESIERQVANIYDLAKPFHHLFYLSRFVWVCHPYLRAYQPLYVIDIRTHQ